MLAGLAAVHLNWGDFRASPGLTQTSALRRRRRALEDDRGRVLVDRAPELAVAAFLRDPDRREVLRIDQAHGARRAEAAVAPGRGRADRLGRVAAPVAPRDERPAELRDAGERRVEAALEVGEAELADVLARLLLLDGPIAEAQQGPVAAIAEQARPGLRLGRPGTPRRCSGPRRDRPTSPRSRRNPRGREGAGAGARSRGRECRAWGIL